MRDIPGLTQLLDRVGATAPEPPRFRFHGNRNPANRQRTPILDQAPSVAVSDGVAKLRLFEPIDDWGGVWGVSAQEFVEVVDSLDDSVTEIRLHINSPGGMVWEALAILNTLRSHPARLVAVVDGIAASAASFIACAADETIMAPNTQLMIHDASAICAGDSADMRDVADLLDQVSDNIASIYATKVGTEVKAMRDAMRAETWYTAQEAVDAGLADSIAGAEEAEEPAAKVDVSGVGAKYASREEAPPPPAAKAAPVAPAANERDARFRARRHAANEKRFAAA